MKEKLRYAQLKRNDISKEEYALVHCLDTRVHIKNRATMSSNSRMQESYWD
jgi:hypothetical protein